MIWTRRMNAIAVHDAFTPQGSSAPPVPAGAGCIWLHLYQAVTGGAGRYVRGGGCTTVGVPGLMLGGGFGSFSKFYGLAAAEPAGSRDRHRGWEDSRRQRSAGARPDLKGGVGGTFGVVTRVTRATHELPENFGSVHVDVQARSDEAYRRLLARFVDVYATSLFNPHWGEQAIAR
jgi:FAD/FMN-containing dehydrogenase